MNRLFLSSFVLLALIFAGDLYAAEYRFTNIADTTTAAPIGTFSSLGFGFTSSLDFKPPAISGTNVVFFGKYGQHDHGIFTGNGGPIITIVKTGDAAPSDTFYRINGASISGDTATFSGEFNDIGGIFAGNGGPLSTIAKTGDISPAGRLIAVGQGAISGDTVAFLGRYFASNQSSLGVFTGSGGALTTIVKTGDAAPTGMFESSFSAPAISGANVAFRGAYAGGAGIFVGSGGELTTIAKSGDVVPFGSLAPLSELAISGNTVAFAAALQGSSQRGIFAGDGGSLTKIVVTGEAAPSGIFDLVMNPSIGGNEVIFLGFYGGFSHGIFVGNGGPLTTVIKNGDRLFGSAVTRLDFGRFGFDPDGSGNLAFNYRLADGRWGVAMASPVPEPSTVLVSFFVPVCAVVLFHRKRCGD